jgi:hypothetical protein
MLVERRLYAWSELGEIPDGTGVYAWYYRHMLTTFDIQELKGELARLTEPSRQKKAADVVTKFLHAYLFGPLAEEPYHASMRGRLKPQYEGRLDYSSPISDSLVARLVANPDRLFVLQKILAEAVPEFASPIYIGMSVDLRSRLRRHKRLIETFKAAGAEYRPEGDNSASEEDRADHSFAWDVVRRGLSVNRLEVSVRQIAAHEGVHVDAENILNRINFPLCGRI